MSQQLKILCSHDSPEIVALAKRLDGELTDYLVCDRGYNFSFSFSNVYFGEQFCRAVKVHSEFVEVLP